MGIQYNMSCTNNSSDINQTFIIDTIIAPTGSTSACTGVYTNSIISCSGDTLINLGTGIVSFNSDILISGSISGDSFNATNYFSGGTNLLDIFVSYDKFISGGTFNSSTETLTLTRNDGVDLTITGFTDFYTTGATLVGPIIYFNRNDTLSAYTIDLSSIILSDTFVTGGTFNTFSRILTLTKNDNISISISGFSDTFTTGATYSNGYVYFDRNDILSAYTVDLTTLTGDTNTFVTGGTLSGNTLVLNRNDNVNIDVDLSDLRFSGGSGNCITDFYVTNIHGCSPITLHDNVRIISGVSITGGTLSDTISGTTITGVTFYGDGANLTNIANTYTTGGTYDSNTGVANFTNNTGGTFNVSGFFTEASDVFSTGMTFNLSNYDLTIFKNDGNSFFTNLGQLANDVNVTGGTYNSNTGVATFYNNSGGSFNVSGFLTGFTDTRIDSFTYNNANEFVINDSTGGTFSVLANTMTGLTVNGNLISNSISANTISASTFYGNGSNLTGIANTFVTGGTSDNSTKIYTFTNNTGGTFNVIGLIDINITGGTYDNNTGITTLTNNTGGTISISGYFTNTNDIHTSAFTYSNNVATIKQTNGEADLSILINSMTGLTVNGVLSATTYLGLPTDIRVTGGTYSNGTSVFTNNTGGTFNVSGFFTGATDVYVTGGTGNNDTKIYTFTNNTGGTFNVSALTDVRVTGGTYDNANSFTFTNNTGGTFSVLANTMTGLTINGSLTFLPVNTVNPITITRGTNSSDFFTAVKTGFVDKTHLGAYNDVNGSVSYIGANSYFTDGGGSAKDTLANIGWSIVLDSRSAANGGDYVNFFRQAAATTTAVSMFKVGTTGAITSPAYTAGRVPYIGTAGLFSDSSTLAWANSTATLNINGSAGTVPGIDITGNGTIGQIAARNAGTTAQSAIFAANNTNSVYAQMDAFGSAFAGTIGGLNRANMASIRLQPAGSSVGMISTEGAFPTVFATNSLERMRLGSDGRLAIGTSATTAGKLVVVADATNPGIAAEFGVTNAGTSITNAAGIWITNTAATTNNYSTIGFLDSSFGSAIGIMGMQHTDRTNHYGDYVFGTRAADGFLERVRIKSTGPLLIGTGSTSFTGKLQVVATDGESAYFAGTNAGTALTNSAGIFITNINTTTNNYATISFRDTVGGNGSASMGVQFVDRVNNYGDYVFGTRAADGFLERVRIPSAGSLTIQPSATLRDGGWNRTIEIDSNATNPFPIITFGNQTSNTRYGGFNWVRSSTGNTASSQQVSFNAYETGNTAVVEFRLNGNIGTSSVTSDMFKMLGSGFNGFGINNPTERLSLKGFGSTTSKVIRGYQSDSTTESFNITDNGTLTLKNGAGNPIVIGTGPVGSAIWINKASQLSTNFSFQADATSSYFNAITGGGIGFYLDNATELMTIDATSARIKKDVVITGNATLSVAGNGLYIKEGTNATMGVVTLIGGTGVVNTTKVTANSRIFLTIQSLGTVTVPTAVGVTVRVAGTSFTITSANAIDTSVVAWQIIEPA